MESTIYLDYAATSPMYPEVIEVMSEAMQTTFGNASSIHQFGRKSRGYLDEARAVFARSIHANSNEIIITSGGSESDNTAILKTAEKYKSIGKHIITTNIEHEAVLKPMKYLESKGFDVTYLPADKDGFVSAEQVTTALRDDTILVSIMSGNNEVGSIMPIAEIGSILKNTNPTVVFHTDAVQSYGSQDIDVATMNIDLLSVSAHKIGGPKGIGFLYCRENIKLPSLILGGEQETKRRAGTENIPAIIGFQKAVELMMKDKQQRNVYYRKLKEKFINNLKQAGVDLEINGSYDSSLPHIVSIYLKGIDAERLLIHLDLAGIAVSTGSACTAGNVDPSHVLSAMFGVEHPAISETVRISLGLGTTEKDIDKVVIELSKIIKRLK